MKKNLFILLFFIFSSLFSQSYTPLLKDGNKWWISYSEGYCDMCNPHSNSYYIYMNGETTVDNVVYKKMYSNLYYACPYMANCYETNNSDFFECLMREDVLTKKVYFLDPQTNEEKLIYDFSAQKDDVLSSSWLWNDIQQPIVITDVVYGSVFGKDNVKTYQVDWHNIYEGIGSQSGLFTKPAMRPFEIGGFWLNCFEDASGKSCISQFIVLGTSENSTGKNLTLYYSKQKRDFTVSGSPSQEYKISFYDASGRLSEEVNAKGKQSFILRNAVRNKVLFYTIASQGNLWKGKVMVE